MDIIREDLKQKRQRKRWITGVITAGALLAVFILLSGLEPAAPSADRASVFIDSVKRGEMLRQVRGPGVLVPKEIRFISAASQGRVERVLVKPGAVVEADTVLVEMSNPELLQANEEARWALNAAEADFVSRTVTLENDVLNQRARLAEVRGDYASARLTADAEGELVQDNIISEIQWKRSELLAEQLKERLEIETERTEKMRDAMQAQLRAEQARIEQFRNQLKLRAELVEGLKVRAGIAGVLQELTVEEGQQVTIGTDIARVARPDLLIAELRVAETQAKDILLGQPVNIDTRNGIVAGHVLRIDPAVRNGTVQVDVELDGELPRGARPDLSVDGTIEIDRLENVLYVGRPAFGQADSTVSLFKLRKEEGDAVRVQVQLGKTSVNVVEILGGLQEGDQVILSDTSVWDDYDRIKLD